MAVVLAAGAGTRFGDGEGDKLLAELDGRAVVEHVVAAAVEARGVDRVVVVVGAQAKEVGAAARRAGGEVAECTEWAEGQAASLRCGLRAAGEDAAKVLVLVGDQPGVTAAAIDRVAGEPPGTRAAYGGKPGHPAVLGRELIARAQSLTGDRGLRDVTAWRLVECGDVASGRDVDTPEDLEALRSRTGGR